MKQFSVKHGQNSDDISNVNNRMIDKNIKIVLKVIGTILSIGGFILFVFGLLFMNTAMIIPGFFCFIAGIILTSIIGSIRKKDSISTIYGQVKVEPIPVSTTKIEEPQGGLICPKCGQQNDKNAKFCDNCGEKLQKMCPNCGTLNDCASHYCKNCGIKID